MNSLFTNQILIKASTLNDLNAFRMVLEQGYISYDATTHKMDITIDEIRKLEEQKANRTIVDFQLNAEDQNLVVINSSSIKEGPSFQNFIAMSKRDCLNNWFDWSMDNWGTMRDMIEPHISVVSLIDDTYTLVLTYMTDFASSNIVKEMANQFPKLNFEWFAKNETTLESKYLSIQKRKITLSCQYVGTELSAYEEFITDYGIY